MRFFQSTLLAAIAVAAPALSEPLALIDHVPGAETPFAARGYVILAVEPDGLRIEVPPNLPEGVYCAEVGCTGEPMSVVAAATFGETVALGAVSAFAADGSTLPEAALTPGLVFSELLAHIDGAALQQDKAGVRFVKEGRTAAFGYVELETLEEGVGLELHIANVFGALEENPFKYCALRGVAAAAANPNPSEAETRLLGAARIFGEITKLDSATQAKARGALLRTGEIDGVAPLLRAWQIRQESLSAIVYEGVESAEDLANRRYFDLMTGADLAPARGELNAVYDDLTKGREAEIAAARAYGEAFLNIGFEVDISGLARRLCRDAALVGR